MVISHHPSTLHHSIWLSKVAGSDEGHSHPLLVQQHGHAVPLGTDVATLAERVSGVLVADRDDRQVERLGATQGNGAVGFLTDDDQRIHVDLGSAGRDATGGADSRTAVGERDQLGRHDETELLERADFVFVDRLAGAVSRNRGVAREGGGVTQVGVDVARAEHEERGFDRLGPDVRGRCQNRGRFLGVVAHQGTGDGTQTLGSQLAIDGGDGGAGAAEETVRAGADLGVEFQFLDQHHALGHLGLQRIFDVVFVHVRHDVREGVEAGVLDHHRGDVLRDDRIRGRGDTFGRQVVGQQRIDGVRGFRFHGAGGIDARNQNVRVGDGGVIGNPTTEDDGRRGIARQFLVGSRETQHFAWDGAGEDFAFDLANPGSLSRVKLSSHDDLLLAHWAMMILNFGSFLLLAVWSGKGFVGVAGGAMSERYDSENLLSSPRQ